MGRWPLLWDLNLVIKLLRVPPLNQFTPFGFATSPRRFSSSSWGGMGEWTSCPWNYPCLIWVQIDWIGFPPKANNPHEIRAPPWLSTATAPFNPLWKAVSGAWTRFSPATNYETLSLGGHGRHPQIWSFGGCSAGHRPQPPWLFPMSRADLSGAWHLRFEVLLASCISLVRQF